MHAILEMLDAAKPGQKQIKERIILHNKEKKPSTHETKLEEFSRVSESSVEGLLLQLTDRGRIERGMNIGNEEVRIREVSDEIIRATVGQYTVELDIERKMLKHNCDDWRKGLEMKRICKHLVKVFLTIPSEKSKRILKDIIEEKDYWKFESEEQTKSDSNGDIWRAWPSYL